MTKISLHCSLFFFFFNNEFVIFIQLSRYMSRDAAGNFKN